MIGAECTSTVEEPGEALREGVQGAVEKYYRGFVERMTLDQIACPELFRMGASSLIEALYGVATGGQLERINAVSLGCGDPLGAANLVTGEVVVDLGCGLGLDCILAGQKVGNSGRVVGIDLVLTMVNRASATMRSSGQGNVGFAQSAMEKIPLQSGSVDVVISNCAVNLSADKGAVLSEVARVLKPGGRLAIYDILGDSIVPDGLRSDLRRWAGCVSGVLTAPQYLRLLRRAGLIEAQVRESASADGFVECVPGAPRLYVGQVTARQPASSVSGSS